MLVRGDLNCDLLQPDKTALRVEICWICVTFLTWDYLVKEPTRVTATSETSIDLVLTNKRSRFLTTGILEPHINDHNLFHTVMKACHSQTIKDADVTNHMIWNDSFPTWLTVPFHVASIFEDVNDQAWPFTVY